MGQYIDKSALVAELKKRFDYRVNGLKAINNGTFWNEDQSEDTFNEALTRCAYNEAKNEVFELMCFLDTLEVIDPYEQLIQYPSREDGIKAHAEDYSWNIESELFQQLTPEQQKLWRKEIEQACISGGYCGLNLQKDSRYDDNFELKELDLEKELSDEDYMEFFNEHPVFPDDQGFEEAWTFAKYFFKLGLKAQKGEQV